MFPCSQFLSALSFALYLGWFTVSCFVLCYIYTKNATSTQQHEMFCLWVPQCGTCTLYWRHSPKGYQIGSLMKPLWKWGLRGVTPVTVPDRQITSADSLVQSLCTWDGTGGGSTLGWDGDRSPGRISDGRSKQRSLNIIMGIAEGERLPMSIPNEHSK